MSRTIHQLFCTHCTYGTAAQHRHTGNVRNQAFEYSTRAGSVEQSQSHPTFQRFEKPFFRGIPMAGDASVEVRRSTANETPWRKLMYLPSIDGLRVLANVCYRPKDTAGRLGSYFAHVLLEEHSDGNRPWNQADCLKLWGASFWQTVDTDILEPSADEAESSFVLQPVDSLDCPGYGELVNDDALLQFLNAPAEANPQTAGASPVEIALSVFPPRWRKKPPAERARLMTTLIRAVLELNLEHQERLTIAAEPGVAALLFYGIVRLLPASLAHHLSFSTFESHFDKPSTVLTAHDFADSSGTDLLPETYRAKGFAINTYRPARKLEFLNPESQFPEVIVQTFINEGAGNADRILSQIEAAGPVNRDVCEKLIAVRNRVKNAFFSETSSPTEFSRLSIAEKRLASCIFVDLLAGASDDTIKSLARKPIYLYVLESISSVAGDPIAKQAALSLVRVLPGRDDVRNAFFASTAIPAGLKIAWLKSFLNKAGQFPKNCPGLFETSSKSNAVLSELLQHATADQALTWVQVVPPEFVWQFAAALASAAEHDPQKRPLLVRVIERLEDADLCKLLDKASGRAEAILAVIKPDDARFAQRLNQLFDSLSSSPPEQLVLRLDALLANSSRLPSRKLLLERWIQAREAVKRCGQHSSTVNAAANPELEAAVGQVLRSIAAALSDFEVELTPLQIDVKRVEPLLRGWLKPDQAGLLQTIVGMLPRLQLAATDDTALCSFLASAEGAAWLKKYPRSDQSLASRLRTILADMPDNLLAFRIHLAGLTAAKSLLGGDTPKWDIWRRLDEMLVWVKKLRDRVSSPDALVGDDVMLTAMNLAPIVYLALGGRMSCDSSQPATKKLVGTIFLEKLSIATIGDKTLAESKVLLRWIEVEFEKQAAAKGGGKISGLFTK